MLYRHALESIFAFLDQPKLVTVLQVSKSWLAAVESMASLRLTLTQTSAPLRVLAESVMGHHVTRIGGFQSYVPVTADSLSLSARLMPQLRELRCDLELTPSQGPLTFSSGLQELRLGILGKPAAADVNAAVEVISGLTSLEVFFIHVDGLNAEFSFAPLASLPLHTLVIDQLVDEVELSDAQVAELRAMPRLHRLDVRPMTTSLLRRLLMQPHDPQWCRMMLPSPLRDEAAALLPQLPSLTTIGSVLGDPTPLTACSNFDFLRRLPNLTHAHFKWKRPSAAGRIESLVAGLQCCTQIEFLGLGFKGLTSAHLAELLPRLPRLHWLTLASGDIATLSFLAQQPLAGQLTSLLLDQCSLLPLTELRHVHALRALEKLRLTKSFDAPMDALSLSLHTPPSPLLSQLEEFEYEKP